MIQFPTTPEECANILDQATEVLQKFEGLLDASSEILDGVKHLKNIDLAYYDAAKLSNILDIIKSVHPSEIVRTAAEKHMLNINKQIQTLTSDHRLYTLLNGIDTTDLSEEDKYYVIKERQQMEADGSKLDVEQREELLALTHKMSELSAKFISNSQNTTVQVTVADKTLQDSGLDRERLTLKGNELILNYPTYMYVMENSASQELRQSVYRAQNQIAFEENNDLINQYISLANQKARLVGFSNAAEHQLSTESVRTTERLESFYESVFNTLAEKSDQELVLLKEHYSLDKLQLWDIPYYINKYKTEQGFDKSKFREYFVTKKTIPKILEIYEEFFGIKLQKTKARPEWGLWDTSVKVYRVTRDGEELGHILADIYPRKGKFAHMCMMRVSSRVRNDLHNDQAFALVIANLDQHFLTHDSLLTFFHEFGHAIHQILGCTEWASTSGNACLTDFVECSSQLLEEWIWDPEVLQYFADGKIPESALEQLLATRKTFMGNELIRQAMLGSVAFRYFRDNLTDMSSRRELWQEIMECYQMDVQYDDAVDMTTRFLHLCVYGCKYYSYLWSKCIAIEIFNKIRSETSLLQAHDKGYLAILEAGGSKEPISMVQEYLGHELTFSALETYLRPDYECQPSQLSRDN